MIDLVKGCFKITQFDDKRTIPIENLIETKCFIRYPVQQKFPLAKDLNSLFMSSENP